MPARLSSACGSRAAPYRPKGAASDGFAGTESESYVSRASLGTVLLASGSRACPSHLTIALHHRLADCHDCQESQTSSQQTISGPDLLQRRQDVAQRAKEGPDTSKCELILPVRLHVPKDRSSNCINSLQTRRRQARDPRGVKCLMSNRADGAAGKRRRWLRRSARGKWLRKKAACGWLTGR